MSKETITLDNFTDFYGEVNGVEIACNLPVEEYVPSSDIHINLGRIARAAKIGRLETVLFERYSESDSMSPGVNSVSEDGSATVSFSSSATRTPRIRYGTDRSHGLWNKGMGLIKINFAHDDLNDVNLREAKPWAEYLNTSMRKGLERCSNNQLYGKNKIIRPCGFVVYNSLVVGLGSAGSTDALLQDYAAGVISYNILLHIFAWFNTDSPEHTLVPYMPLDRMGLVQAYTRTRKFVEAK